MDVDKLQKINQLANELKSHGMATDMVEAVQQAESMVNSDQERSRFQESADPAPSKMQEEMEENVQVRRMQNKIDSQVEVINQLQSKMNEMIETINRLEKEQARLGEHMQSNYSQKREEFAPEEPAPEVPEQKIERQTQFTPEEKKDSPRSGSYAPKDVAIDKIFYYGTK